MLEGRDHGAKMRLTITALPKAKRIGSVETRAVEETTPLEPKSRGYKFCVPGISLNKDRALLLTRYGPQER